MHIKGVTARSIFTGGGGRDGPRLEDERGRGDDDRVGPLPLVEDGL